MSNERVSPFSHATLGTRTCAMWDAACPEFDADEFMQWALLLVALIVMR